MTERVFSGVPPAGDPIPPTVLALAGRDRIRPVWRNELDGRTYELTGNQGRRFVKWAPAGSGLDLGPEVGRLAWASAYATVPRVLDAGTDATGSWLLTAALPGENAVTPRWKAEPRTAATAIGRGLRTLHDRLPAGDCPFSWSVADRLAQIPRPQPPRPEQHRQPAQQPQPEQHQQPEQHRQPEQRQPDGQEVPVTGGPGQRHAEFAHLSPADTLAVLADPPPIDRLVVCHGDPCAPNTLIDEAGDCCGHVDLGALGLADRWADLAVATDNLGWNYGPGLEPVLLAAYGIEPNPERTFYYRLLWAATP